MARGVNKVTLIGHLGGDPEQRRTQTGALVVNFNVATTESWRDQETKERQERTEWHRVVFFGRSAEVAAEYLRKGSLVYIEGRLQTRKYQDQRTGQDRYITEIVGREMNMLDSRRDSQGDSYGGSQSSGYSRSRDDSRPAGGSQSTRQIDAPAPSDDPIDDMPW